MSMKLLPLLLGGVLLAASLPAQAESDRNWVLELQFGGFFPDVDKEPGLVGTPFADVFGTKSRLLSEISIERLVFKDFGSLGFGLKSGFTEFFGHGFIEGTETPSIDTASLRIVPINAFVAYRLDYAAIEWNFPFVPYAKAGIGGWIFWITDSKGDIDGGGKAKGVKWGWTYSAGLMLLLDVFDPRLSNEFDREFGVNNTYLFVDYTHQGVDNFGGKGFDFSDNVWSGGIAFEF